MRMASYELRRHDCQGCSFLSMGQALQQRALKQKDPKQFVSDLD
jgi:hypothetical protein